MLWISNAQCQTLNKHIWQARLIFKESLLVDKYIHKATSFDISLEEEAGSIAHIFQLIASKQQVLTNPGLVCRVQKKVKVTKSVEHIEQRIKKSHKKK